MSDVRPVILMALSQAFVWASIFYLFPALLLSWETDMGWSRAEVSAAITIAVVLSGLFAPLAGRMIDQGRSSQLMVGGAILAGTGLTVLMTADSLPIFYLAWGIIGIAMAGTLYEPCFAVVTRSKGEDAQKAITAITLIAGFASAISFPVTIGLADAFGWRASVALAALTCVLVVAPLNYFGVAAYPPAPQDAEESAGPRNTFLRQSAHKKGQDICEEQGRLA